MPKKKTQEEFVAELKQTHPNLKVIGKYSGDKKYVDVYCTIHNYKFSTKPNWLHHGSNCQKCYNDRRGLTLKKDVKVLIEEMNEKHNRKYTYPYVEKEYKDNKSKITIVCPIHGEFTQTINHHLRGQGCDKCNESHLERFTEEWLKTNNIDYISQYRNYSILGYKSLDFYLPKYNVAIECQGIQHFKSVEYFGGDKSLKETIVRDFSKYSVLKDNNIRLIYITLKSNKKYLCQKKFNDLYINNVYFKEDIENNNINLGTILG